LIYEDHYAVHELKEAYKSLILNDLATNSKSTPEMLVAFEKIVQEVALIDPEGTQSTIFNKMGRANTLEKIEVLEEQA
jgi:hypothetical protein